MEFLLRVGVTAAALLGYLAVGVAANLVFWRACLRRFGRDRVSLDPYEESSLVRLGVPIIIAWPVALGVLVGFLTGRWFVAQIAHVLSQRWFSHLSEDLDAPRWQCALVRGRHQDDVADLERDYTLSAPAAGPVELADGDVYAELHTARCPGCGVVMYRTALVLYRDRRDSTGEVMEASAWLPQEHDLVWSARTSRAGRRALESLLTSTS